MTTAPSSSAGSRVLRAVVPAVLVPLLFVTAFVFPAHHPQPNGLKVAVAGPPAAAGPIVQGLGDVDLVAMPSARAARDAVRDRDAYAAIVTSPRPTVDVASGAGFVVASALRQGATQAGLAPEQIRDVAPLPDGDPRGATLSLVVLALLITSITGAALGVQILPDLRAGRREPLVLLVALLVGMGTTAILKAITALPGPFVPEAALFAALVSAVALVAGALVRLRGSAGITLGFLFFLVIAQPAAGLASAPDMLPTPWKQFGPLLPPGALGDALHATAYFGGAAVLTPVLTLAGWAVLGMSLNAWADRSERGAHDQKAAPAVTAQPVTAG